MFDRVFDLYKTLLREDSKNILRLSNIHDWSFMFLDLEWYRIGDAYTVGS